MIFLYALPQMMLFVVLSDQWSPGGFIVGYVVGLMVSLLVGARASRIRWQRLPSQLFWLVVYIVQLFVDILISSVDVARKVLDPRLPINPGTVVVPTQDPKDSAIIAALSAHAITVTPGEMVEGFIEGDGETRMIIHTLDIDETQRSAAEKQAKRLELLRRIVGEEV
ncbi:Na+/H+ antiporter subunit E [Kamptonema cortianum]|nr:Na+/H+ antiporter subunit E [Kamptonema cortianum]